MSLKNQINGTLAFIGIIFSLPIIILVVIAIALGILGWWLSSRFEEKEVLEYKKMEQE